MEEVAKILAQELSSYDIMTPCHELWNKSAECKNTCKTTYCPPECWIRWAKWKGEQK